MANNTDLIDFQGFKAFKDEYVDVKLGEKVGSDDARLSDARPASDVSAWAKAATKPTYTPEEVGALPVGTTHLSGDLPVSLKGAVNGVAELDSNGRVPSSQLPGYVDDTVEGYRKAEDGKFYANKSGSSYTDAIAGESGKIYVDVDTNTTWRWSGSAYVQIKGDLALGETSSTAFAGNRGKAVEDKLSGIANGAQVNVIESVKVGGTALTLAGKSVDIPVASVADIRSLWANS